MLHGAALLNYAPRFLKYMPMLKVSLNFRINLVLQKMARLVLTTQREIYAGQKLQNPKYN